MNKDSYKDMLAKVQAFHDKHDFKNTGGEELTYRIALMKKNLQKKPRIFLFYCLALRFLQTLI